MQLIVKPSGLVACDSSAQDLSPELVGLAQEFTSSPIAGLLALANQPTLRHHSASLGFWYDFAEQFMRTLCAHLDSEPLDVPPPPQDLVQAWVDSRPPVPGSEYLDATLLLHVWDSASTYIHKEMKASGLPGRPFIDTRYPHWANVGKVCFHLAEYQKDPATPFAFMVTYTTRVADKARVQHRPLGLALSDSQESGQEAQLKNLLQPILEAARHSSFIAQAVASQSIYSMRPLAADEAWQFLQDIPAYEQAGIICRVPQSWRGGRPSRAKVAVQVGASKGRGYVGFDNLVDFRVDLAIDGANLSPEDIEKILASKGPLTFVRGRWVEVNRDKISRLLGNWRNALNLVGQQGMTMGQAMRLLAGFGAGAEDNEELPSVDSEWCDVIAGESLRDLLAQLRNPDNSGSVDDRIAALLKQYLRATLRPYQVAGVRWLKLLSDIGLGGCLADDMGLGKTIQIIALLLVEKYSHPRKFNACPSLLVLPSSLLGNWRLEIEKFAPGIAFQIVHPSVASAPVGECPADLNQQDLVITSYGMLARIPWILETAWQFVFIDEAQAIKNAQTKQAKLVRALKAHVRFALTGTPVENNLNDLWSIFQFTSPGLLGTQQQFRDVIKRIEAEKKPDYSPIRNLISPYLLRRRKTDKTIISDLPDKVELTAYCSLSARQIELYQKQVELLVAALKQEESEIARKGMVLASLMQFKQICNHPSQYLGNDRYEPAISGKFSKLRELAETIAARQEKLLVFTQFREITDVINHYLSEIFGRTGLVLHGGTPVAKRQGLVQAFQSDDGPPFFVLSLKAGGTGLNLTAASHVIHFDRWWNPAVENQATDRAFRIGQKHNVLVHKFVCRGTIEEKIDMMLRSKQRLADALVNKNAEVSLTELSNDEIMALVKLDITALDDTE